MQETELKKISSLMGNAGIIGASLSVEWKEIEPQENHYRWDILDEPIRTLNAMGKLVTVRIFPGISTPNWVYEKGANAFEFIDANPFHGEEYYSAGHRLSTYGQTLRIPVPWDETFLAHWTKFIEAFATHYRDTNNIAMIHITGPTKHSAEMVLPKSKQDQQKWKSLGYTPEKLITAWTRCIDTFARAFPHTSLVLNLSPVIFNDNVMQEVPKYGYMKYGQRFRLQNNILLAGDEGMNRKDWDILREYSSKTTIGFQRQLLRLDSQRLSHDEKTKLRRANFQGTFEKGLSLGAKYFEVGAAEVVDFPDVVEEMAKRMRK